MAGRHDRAADESRPGLLATGPIVVRGLTRGVRDALRPGQDSRHRSDDGVAPSEAIGRDSEGPEHDEGDDVTKQRPASEPDDDADVTEQRPAQGSDARTDDATESRSPAGPEGRDDLDDGVDEPSGRERDSDDASFDVEEEAPSTRAEVVGSPSSTPVVQRAPLRRGTDPDLDGPGRARGLARFRERRELAGVAVLLVLAIVCAGLIVAVVVKTRTDAATAAREAADYTPPPLTSTPTPSAAGPSIAVVSDETASKAAKGVAATARWPRLLARSVEGSETSIAATGAGYTVEGATGATFVQAARRVPSRSDVVLFLGGAADGGASALALARAATEAYSEASQQAPDAVVVAVGPIFRPPALSEQSFSELRTTLRNSARIAGVRWVDPVSSGWLSSVADVTDLTSADEKTLADRLQSVVETSR